MTSIRNHKNLILKNVLIISSFLLISFLSVILLFHNHIITNIGDAQFHLKRIAELSEDLKHHDFLPSFAFNQFNGSAVMLVYPYLNLYPVALLFLLLKSKILVLFLLFVFNTLIGLIISFYSSKRFTKSIYISYLFSIIYIVSTIFIGYSFRIFDLGSSSAYIFAPLVIFGFLKIFENKQNSNYLELAIGLTLMSFSHIPDTIIFITFIILWAVINIKNINLHIIYNLFKALLLSILLLGIYIIPFIHFLIYNYKTVHFTDLVMPKGISIFSFVKTAFSNDDVMGISIFAIIAIFLAPFFYKKLHLYAKQMYWLSLIIIIGCSSLIKWAFMPSFIVSSFEHFQFMYRFLLIPILLLDYLFANIIIRFFNRKKMLFLVIIGLVLLLQLTGQGYYIYKFANGPHYVMPNNYLWQYQINTTKKMNRVINNRPNGPDPRGIVTKTSTGSDYYPKGSFPKLNYINNNKGISNNHNTVIFRHSGYNSYSFYNKRKDKVLNIPLIGYNKENIQVYLNHHFVRSYVNKNNLISICNIHRGKYNVFVKYNSSKELDITKILLSCLGLMWVLIIIIKKWCFIRKIIK